MRNRFVAIAVVLAGLQAGCSADPSLKEIYKDSFLVGAAVSQAVFTGRDAVSAAIVRKHFNTITAENVLKWQHVQPKPGVYPFEAQDRFVEFGEKNGMFIVGHTLVWHNQTPEWVFQDEHGGPASRELLLGRLRDHIHTVVGRYKGRIHAWDVVNEALNSDGTLRETPWLKIIGEEYLAKAFQFAHEADPAAELYYNDYSLEYEAKRDGAVALIRRLQAQGVPVAGIGSQGHNKLARPTVEQHEAMIAAFRPLGIKIMITELDVDVLPPATRGQGAEVTTGRNWRLS